MFKLAKSLGVGVFVCAMTSFVNAKTNLHKTSLPMVALSPFVQSVLNENPPSIKDEDNLMMALYGLSAPINREPLDYAQKKLSENRLYAEQYQAGLFFNSPIQQRTQSTLAWQGDFSQLCNLGVDKCFAQVAQQKTIYEALAQKNSVILERYQQLLSLKIYVFNEPFYISSDWPNYGLATSSSKLNLFRIANQLQDSDTRVRLHGLEMLDQQLSIWLVMAKSKHSLLIDKMVAFAMIHRHLHVVAEFLENNPTLSQAEIEILQSLLERTLAADTWDMKAVFRGDFKFFVNLEIPLRKQFVRLFFSDESKLSEKERELKKMLIPHDLEMVTPQKNTSCLKLHSKYLPILTDRYFDLNEFINYYGEVLQSREHALTLPPDQQKASFIEKASPFPNHQLIDQAIARFKKTPCELLKNRQKINIIGRMLSLQSLDNPETNVFVFIERSRDHEAFAKLVHALFMIRKTQIPISQVNDFLNLHRNDYSHSLSGKPIAFDEARKLFTMDVVTRHFPQQSRFELEWR